MSKIVFDTNIYIDYPLSYLPDNVLLSAVVVMERIAGRETDETLIKYWQKLSQDYERDGDLLVPTGEDWWFAGKVLNALGRGLPSRSKKAAPIDADQMRRLIRDVLIARSVKRVNATLITKNMKDFGQIKRFCNVKLISAQDYFGA